MLSGSIHSHSGALQLCNNSSCESNCVVMQIHETSAYDKYNKVHCKFDKISNSLFCTAWHTWIFAVVSGSASPAVGCKGRHFIYSGRHEQRKRKSWSTVPIRVDVSPKHGFGDGSVHVGGSTAMATLEVLRCNCNALLPSNMLSLSRWLADIDAANWCTSMPREAAAWRTLVTA